MKRTTLRVGLAFLLAFGPGTGAVVAPQSRAAEADHYLRLAARRDDPALPIVATPHRSRPSAKPTVPPFALPTSPITVNPQEEQKPGASPGGSEFPPYEKEMLRLAEILGAMHYLRTLCGAEEGNLWRDKMEELMQAESPNPAWRARLVDAFNSGYRGFDRTYRQCTPSAAQAINLYLAEGRNLTGIIKSRYAD